MITPELLEPREGHPSIDPASRLILQVEAAHATVPLRSLLDMLGSVLALIRELDSAITGDSRGTMEWVVVDLHASDLTAVIEQRPRRGPAHGSGGQVARLLAGGFGQLQDGGTIPPYFSDVSLHRVESITSKLPAAGAFSVTAAAARTTGRVDVKVRERVRHLLAPTYTAIGSVMGRLEMISVHRGQRFTIYEQRTGRAVRCSPGSVGFELVKESLGALVLASGEIRRNASGDPLTLSVDSIERWPSTRIPSLDELYGSDPAFTGDLTIDERVAEVRGR